MRIVDYTATWMSRYANIGDVSHNPITINREYA